MSANPVYLRALSILYAAGHRLAPALQCRMDMAAPFEAGGFTRGADAKITSKACDLLEQFGFAPDRSRPISQMLRPAIIRPDAPIAGDIVELTGPWAGCEVGAHLVLGTSQIMDRFQIGKAIAQMTDIETVSLTGGPISIRSIPAYVLKSSGRKAEQNFWRQHSLFQPGCSTSFARLVPIWTWDGSELDFELPTYEEKAA